MIIHICADRRSKIINDLVLALLVFCEYAIYIIHLASQSFRGRGKGLPMGSIPFWVHHLGATRNIIYECPMPRFYIWRHTTEKNHCSLWHAFYGFPLAHFFPLLIGMMFVRMRVLSLEARAICLRCRIKWSFIDIRGISSTSSASSPAA